MPHLEFLNGLFWAVNRNCLIDVSCVGQRDVEKFDWRDNFGVVNGTCVFGGKDFILHISVIHITHSTI